MARASHIPDLAAPVGVRGLIRWCPILVAGLIIGLGIGPSVGFGLATPPVIASDSTQDDSLSLLEVARQALVAADVESREAALEALKSQGPPEVVRAVLAERSDAAAVVVAKSSVFKKLRRVADLRRELDAARAVAWKLIFDREQYFTPYRVPAVTPAKAVEYLQVQREVDDLVESVEDAWGKRTKVKLPKSVRAALEDLDWSERARVALDAEVERGSRRSPRREAKMPTAPELASGLPEWVRGLPLDTVDVSVRTFAWNARERDGLALDRAVLLHNQECLAWARKDRRVLEDDERPSASEAQQVEITNEYRLMLGVRALAWHPALQVATRGHSDYMARSGVLSHYQSDSPETRDFALRCGQAGYGAPRGENCSRGLPDARATHGGWCRSSGHHRNLLDPAFSEMASAVTGEFWTQNFGDRKVTVAELRGWREALGAK